MEISVMTFCKLCSGPLLVQEGEVERWEIDSQNQNAATKVVIIIIVSQRPRPMPYTKLASQRHQS